MPEAPELATMKREDLSELLGKTTPGRWHRAAFGLYCDELKLAHFGPVSFGNRARSTSQSEANCQLAALAPDLARGLLELREAIVAFAGPWAAQWAKEHGLPDGHLHPEHYDLLERCGARMIDFTRAEMEPANG